MLEIIISAIIALSASYILIKNIKKKISGKCNCSDCSSNCPLNKKNTEK